MSQNDNNYADKTDVSIVLSNVNERSNNQVQTYDNRRTISDAALKLLQASKAANTRKAYSKDIEDYNTWCYESGLEALPVFSTPEMVGNYLSYLIETGYQVKRKNKQTGKTEWVHKDYTAATIKRKIASISQAHEFLISRADPADKLTMMNPTKTAHVHDIWDGIKRTIGTAQTKKQAATVEIMRSLAEVIPDDLKGVRDRALLTIGFGGGFRRSELVAFDMQHVKFTYKGVTLLVRKSKTDQEGKGEEIAVYYGVDPKTCPVRALKRWIEEAGITHGPLFRKVNRHGQIEDRLTGAGVAHIIKTVAKRAGFDSLDFSGHSLRRGFITTAIDEGKSEESIMRQTRHQSIATMRGYIERKDPYKDNASDGIGL